MAVTTPEPQRLESQMDNHMENALDTRGLECLLAAGRERRNGKEYGSDCTLEDIGATVEIHSFTPY